jgi:hypothetical protein
MRGARISWISAESVIYTIQDALGALVSLKIEHNTYYCI